MACLSRCSKLLGAAALLAGAASAVPLAPTIRLRNGVEMPAIAEGTGGYNDTEAELGVKNALQVGFRMLDTAHDYGNQVGVGRGLRASGVPREQVFLQTKVPGCGDSMDIHVLRCYEDTKSILEKNLADLGVDYVDNVLIHYPPLPAFVLRTCKPGCGEVRNQWRALEEFYAAGKAKAIGVSNYCPSCFACLDGFAKVFPMVNQVQYHIGMGPDAKGFLTEAIKRNVTLQAYSPLGNNPLKPGANPEIVSGKVTSSIAKAHNRSTIAVALRYLAQHGAGVIVKSSSSDHLAEDLDLWSWNLTAAEMDEADKLKISGMPSFACNFEAEELVV